MKQKTCKICKEKFTPLRPLQQVCGFECSILLAQNKRIKSEKVYQNTQKRELKVMKEAIKPRSAYIKEAQTAWNTFRRTEDGINRGGKCISCGTTNGKQNCGHYRSVGSNPSLRFEPLNTWLQCERCNTFLHSNAIEFRLALANILTQEQLNWLEGYHAPKKYTIDELKEIISTCKVKIKSMKNLY